VDPLRWRRYKRRLADAAPPADDDLGGMHLDAEELLQAAANSWTWEALDALMEGVDDAERAALCAKAQATAAVLGLPPATCDALGLG